MAQLRFHWDFFGPDARKTAEHFLQHLDEFCTRERISEYKHNVIDQKVRCSAVLECDEQYLKTIRDSLRPVRGERILED